MKRQNESHTSKRLPEGEKTSRRQFLAAGSVLAGAVLSRAYADEDNTIRIALVGCGGRGGGAADNALSSKTGPTKLVAMADVFENKQMRAYKALSEKFPQQVDVPPERRFLGFDAYRKAIDCLRPGDIMIQATHSAFRPMHLKYAVEKGVNAFIEKSFAPDPGGTREILRLGEEAGQAAGVDEVDDELPRNQVIGQTPGYLNGPGHAQGRRVDDEGVSPNEGLVEAAPGDDGDGTSRDAR